MLKFTSPLPPSSNEYLAKCVRFQGKKPYVHVYKTKDALNYENYMIKTLKRVQKEQKWIVPNKNKYIIMELVYYMNKLGRDIDNTYKLLIDSLANSGLIINDDKVIPIPKNIYIDKNNPRIEVTLKISDKQGIFDNMEHLNDFVNKNCNLCSRYNNNCSILKNACENRIQEDIILKKLKCNKIKKRKGGMNVTKNSRKNKK